jgi:hypothetical protein
MWRKQGFNALDCVLYMDILVLPSAVSSIRARENSGTPVLGLIRTPGARVKTRISFYAP